MRIFQIMHFNNSEYLMFKESGRLADFHNCQYMGYDYFLSKGYDVNWYVPKCRGNFQSFLCKLLKIKESVVGLLNVSKDARGYDVIYCPLDNHYFILGILKRLGLIKIPIFCISHLSFNTEDTENKKLKFIIKLGRYVMFKSFDFIAFISSNLLKRAQMGSSIPNKYCNSINWGADIEFYDTDKSNAHYYVAIGQAMRDFKTLVKAFEQLPESELKILARGDTVLKGLDVESLPKNIEIIDNPYDLEHWNRMKEIYAGAKASLIPLTRSHHIPCGATVITESLASATPILISATSNNMIDVCTEGVGEEIPIGDVSSWITVIKKLDSDTCLLKKYSDNARKASREAYNYNSFCNRVESVFFELVKQ